LPYYFTAADVDFVLSAIELLADEGEAFVPLYRLGWRDGLWRHAGRVPADPAPLSLAPAALWAARDAPLPMEAPVGEEELAAERAAYLTQARELAGALRRRWAAEPPAWNRPLGRPEIDELVWFRYVETDGL
jgi:hypothetical protein